MYCDKCHHEHQPIYKKIQQEFSDFIEGNRKWIDEIRHGEIITLPEFINARGPIKLLPARKTTFHINNLGLLDGPYNVRYIGQRDTGEGSMIEFMDEHMDKVFSYYDVM